MRRKNNSSPYQPGLFDSLDDFTERLDTGFEIIPAEKMQQIARSYEKSSGIEEMSPLEPNDNVFFMSFGSGSSGNCAYIGDYTAGFLIDAGVDAKKVTASLIANGISMDRVKGIILTHDHHDHISQAYALLRANRHMRLYCTPRTFNGILRRHNISRRIKDYHTPIYKEFPFKLGQFEITAFEVLHDGSDNAGFHISHSGHNITVATDLGCISPRVDYYMRLADTIIIESNYDLHMLQTGTYPAHLKARILANNGHLDNAVTAEFLAGIATPQLRNVYLCHLSHDNNQPAIALRTVNDALSQAMPGTADPIRVIALPRYDSTPLYTL